MRPRLRSFAMAVLLCVTLTGCETKVSHITAVCRPGSAVTAPVRWTYTSKVDPTVIGQIPYALAITLEYPGSTPRAAPPITTYFYRENGAVLRVVSSSTATMPAKGTFTYHVDTGGYAAAVAATGRGGRDALAFFVVVDGSAFGGLLSSGTCGQWADGHLEIGTAAKLPDLKGKVPLNMAQSEWLDVMPLPPAVTRTEGSETSTYAFFKAPVALTEMKNETEVPAGVAKQQDQVGVSAATPRFSLMVAPSADTGTTVRPSEGGKT